MGTSNINLRLVAWGIRNLGFVCLLKSIWGGRVHKICRVCQFFSASLAFVDDGLEASWYLVQMQPKEPWQQVAPVRFAVPYGAYNECDTLLLRQFDKMHPAEDMGPKRGRMPVEDYGLRRFVKLLACLFPSYRESSRLRGRLRLSQLDWKELKGGKERRGGMRN